MKQVFLKVQLITIILSLIVTCMSVPIQTDQTKLIYLFNNVPAPSKHSFEVVQTQWYWFGIQLGNTNLDRLLEMEASRVTGARGIKNLEIKVYNKTWYSYYWLPNPLAIITGTYLVVIGSVLGFTNRSYYVKGEVF